MMVSYARFQSVLVAAVALVLAQAAFAQAEASATPEPGDSPVVEQVEVTAPEPVETESATPSTDDAAASAESTPVIQFDPKSIEQRVDNTTQQEVIRVAPRSRKNVSRIDNLPNRPKVTPVAIIKGPVSPWGYATRYLNGEVDRPSAKDLQGGTGQPGLGNRSGSAQSDRGTRLRGIGGSRNRDDE